MPIQDNFPERRGRQTLPLLHLQHRSRDESAMVSRRARRAAKAAENIQERERTYFALHPRRSEA
jgi:hypothetical protein